MNPTAFHNASILDCTGRDPYHGTVVIAGDRIQAVGPADQVSTPRDATSVELGGLTLMPGLIDVHTHLGMVVADETVSVEDRYPGATYAFYVAERIEECLMSGCFHGRSGWSSSEGRDYCSVGVIALSRIRIAGLGYHLARA